MARTERVICAASALEERGAGVRFMILRDGIERPAFVVRYDGRPHAYINACAHVAVELDWLEGAFFDTERRYLICATHGATYEPDSGRCIAGPCRGARLTPLEVIERDGDVVLIEGLPDGMY